MVTPQERERKPNQLHFLESARNALNFTLEEAQKRNSVLIETSHLFLGLMRDPTIKKTLVQFLTQRYLSGVIIGPKTETLVQDMPGYSLRDIERGINAFERVIPICDKNPNNHATVRSTTQVKNVIEFADNNAKASKQQHITPMDLLTGLIFLNEEDFASFGIRLLGIDKSNLPRLINIYNNLV